MALLLLSSSIISDCIYKAKKGSISSARGRLKKKKSLIMNIYLSFMWSSCQTYKLFCPLKLKARQSSPLLSTSTLTSTPAFHQTNTPKSFNKPRKWIFHVCSIKAWMVLSIKARPIIILLHIYYHKENENVLNQKFSVQSLKGFCVCQKLVHQPKLVSDLWAQLRTLIMRICYVTDPLINIMNNSLLAWWLSKSRWGSNTHAPDFWFSSFIFNKGMER